MTKSMTKGNPLTLILQFAWPLLLGNLFQQAYNIADAAIVGKTLGADALGAVGVSSSVQFLIYGFVLGVTCGFGIPIATSFGAEKEDEMRQYVYIGGVLSLVISAIITVFACLYTGPILEMLKTPANLFANGYTYLFIIFAGMPFTLMYNYFSAVLRSIGDSKTPTIILVIASVFNVGLDLVCILNLHWGIAGAAIATIFSQALAALATYIIMKRKFDILTLKKENKVMDKKMVLHMLNMGIPFSFQMSMTAVGAIFMQAANNGLGSNIYVTGFTAATKIRQFAIGPIDAMASSIATYVSQNRGANEMGRIKKGIVLANWIIIGYSAAVALIFHFFGDELTLMFVSEGDTAVIASSYKALIYSGYLLFTLGILIINRASAQGLGYSQQAVFAGVLEMATRIYVARKFVPVDGYTAVCYADPISWVISALYVLPMCIYAFKKVNKQVSEELNPAHGIA